MLSLFLHRIRTLRIFLIIFLNHGLLEGTLHMWVPPTPLCSKHIYLSCVPTKNPPLILVTVNCKQYCKQTETFSPEYAYSVNAISFPISLRQWSSNWWVATHQPANNCPFPFKGQAGGKWRSPGLLRCREGEISFKPNLLSAGVWKLRGVPTACRK